MDENKALNFIIERRSIRKYTGEKIPEENIIQIVKAAMYAPSAVNKQPWHFIIIDRSEIFENIIAFHPHAKFLKDASHAILVCGDTNLHHDEGYYVVDCGAATQNILLAASALGIGSCWIGIHPRNERKESIRQLFKLPENIEPYSLVALGYPSEQPALPERFKPERISYNAWSN